MSIWKNESSCTLECLKEIENAFNLYLPPEDVAAVFFEPIAGDSGIIVPPKNMYKLYFHYVKNTIYYLSLMKFNKLGVEVANSFQLSTLI